LTSVIDVRLYVNAGRRRSPVSSIPLPPRSLRACCSPRLSARPCDSSRRCTGGDGRAALRRCRLVAQHRCVARRHDHRCVEMTLGDIGVNAIPEVGVGSSAVGHRHGPMPGSDRTTRRRQFPDPGYARPRSSRSCSVARSSCRGTVPYGAGATDRRLVRHGWV
jgi:hypothetical protein